MAAAIQSKGHDLRREYLEFHNSTDKETKAALILDLSEIPGEIKISFRLNEMNNAEVITASMEGIKSVFDADPDELLPIIEGITFYNKIYEAHPYRIVRINELNLPAFGFGAILIYISIPNNLQPGKEYSFEVLQEVNNQIVGGSRFIISIQDDRQIVDANPYAEFLEGFRRELYPWIQDDVEGQREEVPEQIQKYIANLSGKQEVPPIDSPAKGFVSLQEQRDDDGKSSSLSYELDVVDIHGVTSAALHNGKEGENGPVISTLFKYEVPTGEVSGRISKGQITSKTLEGPLIDKQISDLLDLMNNGYTYLNIYTEENPKGEIRGQIFLAINKIDK